MAEIRSTLLWCTIINYAFLLIWLLVSVSARNWLHRIWSGWFRLSLEQFDTVNFAGIVFYKAGILLFNLTPLLALYLIR